jgi:hypothetical protein
MIVPSTRQAGTIDWLWAGVGAVVSLVFIAASVFLPPAPIWQSVLLGLFLTMSAGTVIAYLARRRVRPANATAA